VLRADGERSGKRRGIGMAPAPYQRQIVATGGGAHAGAQDGD